MAIETDTSTDGKITNNFYTMTGNAGKMSGEVKRTKDEFKELNTALEGTGLLLYKNLDIVGQFVENLQEAGVEEEKINELLSQHSEELQNQLSAHDRINAARERKNLYEENLLKLKAEALTAEEELNALKEQQKTAEGETLIQLTEKIKVLEEFKSKQAETIDQQQKSLDKQKDLVKLYSEAAEKQGKIGGAAQSVAHQKARQEEDEEKIKNARLKQAQALSDGDDEAYSKAREEEKAAKKDLQKSQQIEAFSKFAETFGSQMEKSLDKVKTAVVDGLKGLGDNLGKLVDNGVKLIEDYGAKMNFRLESISENAWEAVYDGVHEAFGTSPFVQQETLLKNIAGMIDQGIVYNVEQRAYIAEFAKNIQSTFSNSLGAINDAIRVQQADTTAARLGLQKSLNDYFTEYYSNSEYMNSVFTSVDSGLKDIVARTDYDETAEIEYIIQKWLGALYSVGADSGVVTGIGQALNLLGSGQASQLVSNSYNNLLAISASKAGLDYAQLLTTGLSADNTNKLLASMVTYLSQIADNTEENNVVASAYSNIFSTSLSTLQAAQTLVNSTDIQSLYNEGLNYDEMLGITNTALGNYSKYIPLTTMLSNMWNNVQFSTGMFYANSPVGYLMTKAVDLVDSLTGGGPTIDIQPWGIGTDVNILDMVKSTMFGVGLIGSLLSTNFNTAWSPSVSEWYNSGGIGRVSDDWQVLRQTTNGHGLKATSGVSLSTLVGNSSSADTSQSLYDSASETSDEVQKSQEGSDNDIITKLVNKGDKGVVSSIKVSINAIDKKLEEGKKLIKELTSIKSNAINVNLQYVEGKPAIENIQGNPWASDDWQTSKAQIIAAALGYTPMENGYAITNRIETGADANSRANGVSSEFIQKLTDFMEGEGIPVRLESSDSMSNLRTDLFTLKNM